MLCDLRLGLSLFDSVAMALCPAVLDPVDCITLDCPTHEYREAHPLWAAAREIVRTLSPALVLVCLPIAVRTRDEGADWRTLTDSLRSLGFAMGDFQVSLELRSDFRWERHFAVGHRAPLPAGLETCLGQRMHLSDGSDGPPGLRYGVVRSGAIAQGEREYGFPVGWTGAEGTLEQRVGAIVDAVPVEAAAWIGRRLKGEAA